MPFPVSVIVTVLGAVTTVWTAVITSRAYSREENGRDVDRTGRSRSGIFAASAGFIGVARTTVLGVVALALCFFIMFGGMTMTFIYSLRREFFGEHQARLRTQHHKNEHEALSKPRPHGKRQ